MVRLGELEAEELHAAGHLTELRRILDHMSGHLIADVARRLGVDPETPGLRITPLEHGGAALEAPEE